MPSRRVGFRDQVVELNGRMSNFKGAKDDLSRECLIGVKIQNQPKLLLHKAFYIIYLCYKTSYFNEEINCTTEPSPSVSVPC